MIKSFGVKVIKLFSASSTGRRDTQHNNKVIATLSMTTLNIMTLNTVCSMSLILSVANKPIMLSVVLLNVVASSTALHLL
jgi:hypothetical protein